MGMRGPAVLSVLLAWGCTQQTVQAVRTAALRIAPLPSNVRTSDSPAPHPLHSTEPAGDPISAPCDLHWDPHALLGSVLFIPAGVMAPAMSRVMEALCACTQPGDHLSVVTFINLTRGTVITSAPEVAAIDSCLTTRAGGFEPTPQTTELQGDCIGCGPKRYGVFRGSPPVDAPKPNEGLRITYAFKLDRSNEVLHCPSSTRAQEGLCVTDSPTTSAPTPWAARPTCPAGDLQCAIDEAVRKP